VRITEELLRSRKPRLAAVGTLCADRATPLYPHKCVRSLPTSGGRSVGIVRLLTKSHGVCSVLLTLKEVRDCPGNLRIVTTAFRL
jgi:hypothetical protein